MNEFELVRHREAIVERMKAFDNKRQLITSGKVGEHAYHTKLIGKEVHGTRDSLGFAVGLLYADTDEYTKLSKEIIEEVLKLQDTNPESETFGLWPYFAEESLDEMDAPDWNWADFLGKLLVEILYVHKNKLPESLIEKIENACKYACESVIRRNLGSQYTNVVFMESLLLVSTGELLGIDKYINHGLEKLEGFLGFYHFHGGVFEFNSPCYTPLITRDVGTFLKLVKNEKAREKAEEVNDICWKMIAEHFRMDLLQLAGPHSRAYSDFVDNGFLYAIKLACDGEAGFECEEKNDVETFWTKAYCPHKYRKYFTGDAKPESSEKIIIKGFNYPYFAFSQTATTYHDDDFTIGTFNREELWNQRRPLLGYIKGKEKPYCLRVRCLHDGYDFSSGVLHCVQEKSSVLGIVNFTSNRGDTHIGLDKASDAEYEKLEISFELTGDTDNVIFTDNKNKASIKVGDVDISIDVLAAKFGDFKIGYKTEKQDDKLIYSVILYSGEKRKINLTELKAAYACFTIGINSLVTETEIKENGGYIEAQCNAFGKKLWAKAVKNPEPFMTVMYDDIQEKDGKRLEDIAR